MPFCCACAVLEVAAWRTGVYRLSTSENVMMTTYCAVFVGRSILTLHYGYIRMDRLRITFKCKGKFSGEGGRGGINEELGLGSKEGVVISPTKYILVDTMK